MDSPYMVTQYVDEKRGPLSWHLDFKGVEVARAGIQTPWEGLGMCWFEVADRTNLRPHLRVIMKVIISMLRSAMESRMFWRLESHVEATDSVAVRFTEHFGFTRESIMPRWGPGGRDYHMYRLLPAQGPALSPDLNGEEAAWFQEVDHG